VSARHRIAILGATGSVGASTLEVLALHPERFEVWALTSHQRFALLAEQCARFQPRHAVVADAVRAAELRALLPAGSRTEVHHGPQALCDIAAAPEVDAVMAAIVGAAGLPACLAAARAGKRLMLANKEALVVGGAVFMRAVHEGGATLLPIDSEHSAIFQCLPEDRTRWPAFIDRIVLTASGGPFRTRDPATLHEVTPEQAVAHPNWVMGRKISVDSATMMNKALEVIEARWLFDLEPARIRVVLHPQSIVHSMVVCRDASVMAQLGTPDMKVPIAVGLAWPARIASGASQLDFLKLSALTFEEADFRRFPGLALAYEALAGPVGATALLNAANEEAVAAFLSGTIRFTDIHSVNAGTLHELAPTLAGAAEPHSLPELLEVDAQARRFARDAIAGLRT
jgi:1-deoxy-D-xylulose-5-phosphate reductoisomerase